MSHLSGVLGAEAAGRPGQSSKKRKTRQEGVLIHRETDNPDDPHQDCPFILMDEEGVISVTEYHCRKAADTTSSFGADPKDLRIGGEAVYGAEEAGRSGQSSK